MVKKDILVEYLIPIKESATVNNDFLIKGVAINETTTRNNVRYIAEELQKAAPSLIGKPILKDHENSVDNIVGRVTKASFDSSFRAVMFEGKIMESKYKEMINDGRINSVSIGAMVHNIEESEDGPLIPRGIDFVELSLVAIPADPNAGFAKAMCEKYNHDNVTEATKVTLTGSIEPLKLSEDIKIISEAKASDDIKILEERKMEELDTLKKQLEESNKRIAEMVAEKEAQAKAREEAEKLKIAESIKAKDAEIVKLQEELKAKEKTELKGVVSTTQEKKDLYEGYEFGRADSGKGFAMWKATESLDPKTHPRLCRVGY
jgi:hypothetical protein